MTMQVSIRFKAQGSNSAFGNFARGDLLRCSPAMARHLVEEAKVATYTQEPQAEVPVAVRAPKRKKGQ